MATLLSIEHKYRVSPTEVNEILANHFGVGGLTYEPEEGVIVTNVLIDVNEAHGRTETDPTVISNYVVEHDHGSAVLLLKMGGGRTDNYQKIEAIKAIRAATGLGLKESKDIVDDVLSGIAVKTDVPTTHLADLARNIIPMGILVFALVSFA